jgi:rhodanese-related sulfurtransferase
MRVLKVMFTAIIVAMLLIFLSSSLGILDTHRLFINPTYLLSQIVGGLIMGVGFIVGGFCPGTSVVALATFKIDGLFFVLGTLAGVYGFGESVSLFPGFFNETFWGVFTLPDLFGVSTGWMILMVVIMALFMFFGAEAAENFIGRRAGKAEWLAGIRRPHLRYGALGLLLTALVVLALGQPDLERRWQWMAEKESVRLRAGEVHIDPAELVDVMNDPLLYSVVLDVREERDFNLFHLRDARHVPLDDLKAAKAVDWVMAMPANTVVVVTANGNPRAEEAYRVIKAHGVLNLYILDGGMNGWLERYGVDEGIARVRTDWNPGENGDPMRYRFYRASAANQWPADPGTILKKFNTAAYTKKVRVVKKKVISGGCD